MSFLESRRPGTMLVIKAESNPSIKLHMKPPVQPLVRTKIVSLAGEKRR